MATEYVVLEIGTDDNSGIPLYEEVGTVTAPNSETACRKYAETQDDFNGATFVAVPMRNWKSGRHTLKAETTRRIRST